jgi:hypothetical protein
MRKKKKLSTMIENPPLNTVTFISDDPGAMTNLEPQIFPNRMIEDFVETYLVLFQVNVGRFLSYRRLHMDAIQPSWIPLVCYYHNLPNPKTYLHNNTLLLVENE